MRTSPSPTSVGWVLLPLRLFLAVTFCFAGLQKLANPAFFRASDPASIQSQLHAYSTTSPIGPLLSLASHTPVLVGVIIALGELAAGTGALLGLWTRLAAAGGMVLSLILFLSVSFHSRPYYTGADVVFLFAWTPLLLGGAGDVWSLDAVVARAAPSRRGGRARPVRASAGTAQVSPGPAPSEAGTRREFLGKATLTGLAAILGMVAAGLAAGVGRFAGGTATTVASGASSPPTTAKEGAGGGITTTTAPGTTTTGPAVPSGQVVGQASQVAVGEALRFTDQKSGDPAYVVQPQSGKFLAFDAICPHAGCEVGFQAAANEFVCPCHGSRFSGQSGSVLTGPATRGLTSIPVTVGQSGTLTVP